MTLLARDCNSSAWPRGSITPHRRASCAKKSFSSLLIN